MTILCWLVGIFLAGALIYSTIILGEGTYFGRRVVRWIYSRGARMYDRVRQPVTASDAAQLLPALRAGLLHTPLAPALDVATGTGRVPLLLAAETWYSSAIVGLDLTPAMLAVARQKAAAAGAGERIEWQVGSGDRLGQWPAPTFGLVTCLEALEYFPRPRRAIVEMWRVLAPGGTLMISTWTPRHARWLPGKAWTASRMARLLDRLGAETIEIRPWQPGQYDLVIARKSNADA
jgi:ubiquinone/menaquinone biosynthesis C-methylase UbiE